MVYTYKMKLNSECYLINMYTEYQIDYFMHLYM